jgi:Ca2+-binding EF-hand superfamily protein
MAKISEDELEDIKERFDMFDKIGDGKVEAAQVIDVLRACNQNPLTAEVTKIIEESELKGKRVELEQFCAIYEQIAGAPGQATYEDMMEAFKTFDRDNAGEIAVATLRQLLVNIGDVLTEEQADVIIGKYEDAERGAISYQGMIKSLIGGAQS